MVVSISLFRGKGFLRLHSQLYFMISFLFFEICLDWVFSKLVFVLLFFCYVCLYDLFAWMNVGLLQKWNKIKYFINYATNPNANLYLEKKKKKKPLFGS